MHVQTAQCQYLWNISDILVSRNKQLVRVTAIDCVYKFTQLCIMNTVQLHSIHFVMLHKYFFDKCVVQSFIIYVCVGLSVT
jgi:hypothetical protein